MQYSPDEANVLRSGKINRIPASRIVPGDIALVSVGDRIPADCRLLSVSSSSFRVDQAILTGESVSVSKSEDVVSDVKAVKQDMTNMLFTVRHRFLRPVGPVARIFTSIMNRVQPSSMGARARSSSSQVKTQPSVTFTSPFRHKSAKRPP
jgi:hypothetical protein